MTYEGCGLCAEYQEQAEPGQINSGVTSAMFGSYRGIIATTGLIVVIFSLLGSAVIYSHEGNQSRLRQSANTEARYEEGGQYLNPRAGIPALSEKFAANPEPETTTEREERDLAAQESMAVWAYWMMVLTAVGVAVTATGTGLLLWQIQLTRKAVADTGEATKAMQTANEIAMRGQRPWLKIIAPETGNIHLTGDQKTFDGLNFDFQVRNFGNTPALGPSIQMALFVSEKGFVFDKVYEHMSKNFWDEYHPKSPALPSDTISFGQFGCYRALREPENWNEIDYTDISNISLAVIVTYKSLLFKDWHITAEIYSLELVRSFNLWSHEVRLDLSPSSSRVQ